jgi:hypothetical protein
MSEVDRAFQAYFNQAQPLFAIQHKTGKTFGDVEIVREVRAQIEQAYKAAWEDRGKLK